MPIQSEIPQVAQQNEVIPKNGHRPLVEKLAEACDSVGGVEKKGRNEAQRYDYVKAADVAKAIRRELFKRGIVIIPDEVECTTKQIQFFNAKGEERRSNEVSLKTAYTITDGKETLIMHGFGIAWDAGDKAIYKAKTGALKYFLRGLGLIPDEKDDPEADETIDRAVKGLETNEEFDQRTANEQNLAVFQVSAIEEACKRSGKTEEEVRAYLGLLGEKRIEHLKKGQFAEFLKWANSPSSKPAVKLDDSPKQKAMKKLFAVANEFHIPEEDVKQAAYEKFSVDSMTKLSAVQLGEMASWVKDVADAQAQS